MRKFDEITRQNSCLNKAEPDEPLFVLLGRDPAAPSVIRAWVGERLRLGKNGPGDEQVVEAESAAQAMEEYAAKRRERTDG